MTLDMNPEIRAQWCAALRSGEYQQATGVLTTGDRYCCLGVLTDLYVKEGHPEKFEDGSGWECEVWDYDGVLAPPVREWARLGCSNPDLTPALTASEVNDGGGTFGEIADLIDGGAS